MITRKERNAAEFLRAISAAKRAHRYGAAVEIKDPATYATARLFLAHDALSGAAVTREGDLISVFRHPDSPTRIDAILARATQYARTLDAFDIGGMLPRLYARFGFRIVARMHFDRAYAPPVWDYTLLGEPDVVFMVRDYAVATSTPPVVTSWDAGKAAQAAALEA